VRPGSVTHFPPNFRSPQPSIPTTYPPLNECDVLSGADFRHLLAHKAQACRYCPVEQCLNVSAQAAAHCLGQRLRFQEESFSRIQGECRFFLAEGWVFAGVKALLGQCQDQQVDNTTLVRPRIQPRVTNVH
jgi:hypothetical protein